MSGAAAERTALVVGNARYEVEVGALRNTVNDARAVAKTLRDLGFAVIERTEVTRDTLLRAVAEFRATLEGAEVALFYFAGHGLTVAGSNYLVPLRAGYSPGGEDEVTRRLLAETRLFNVEQAVADMKSGGARCNLVILDACRSNALAGTVATRSYGGGGGLVEMSPPAGSLIAFATDAGQTAQDGEGENGLYTGELLKHLRTPGLTVEQVFKRTRAGVMEASDGRQVPAEYSRLVGDDVFLAGAPSGTSFGPASPVPPVMMVRAESADPPSRSEMLEWVKQGRYAEVVRAVEDQAADLGPGDHAREPLDAVLESVKELLKEAREPSRAVEAAALACERVLDALPRCLTPDDPRRVELTARAHSRRGDARLILGLREAALEDFEQALTLLPQDAYVRYNRAMALLSLDRRADAKAELESVVRESVRQPGARRLALQALEKMK